MNNSKLLVIIAGAVVLFQVGATQADSSMVVNADNGHGYQRIDQALSWKQAKSACAKQKGYLATITSQAENDVVSGIIAQANTDTVWLGGTDAGHEGDWQWITGEPWTYSNWKEGEPNNDFHGAPENYLLSYAGGQAQWNGQWNDSVPDASPYALSYVCEWDVPPAPKYYDVTVDANADCFDFNQLAASGVTHFILPTGNYMASLVDNQLDCGGGSCPIDTAIIRLGGGYGNVGWGLSITQKTKVQVPGDPSNSVVNAAFVVDDYCGDNTGTATIRFTPVKK